MLWNHFMTCMSTASKDKVVIAQNTKTCPEGDGVVSATRGSWCIASTNKTIFYSTFFLNTASLFLLFLLFGFECLLLLALIRVSDSVVKWWLAFASVIELPFQAIKEERNKAKQFVYFASKKKQAPQSHSQKEIAYSTMWVIYSTKEWEVAKKKRKKERNTFAW